MIVHVALSLLCLIAVLLEATCLRCPRIPDSELSVIGRRLVIGGWSILAARFAWLAIEGVATIHLVSVIALTLLLLGHIIRCVNRLEVARWNDERRPGRRDGEAREGGLP